MSTVLVVDAACDLPRPFLDERRIKLLPVDIRIDDQIIRDDKDAQKLIEFYRGGKLNKNHDAESIPYSPEQIEALFKEEIVTRYDFALVQTVSRKRSLIYDNATKASLSILRSYKGLRQEAGREGGFTMRIMNTGTLFCGQGVLAAFATDMIGLGKAKHEILKLCDSMRNRIYSYIVPPDVYYIRERARKKGEDSIGMLTALVARSLDIVPILCGRMDETYPVAKTRGFKGSVNRLFDYAIERIEEGLLTPYIVISYAGDVSELLAFDRFLALEETAKRHQVRVLSCVMGLTGGLNVGPGSVGLALACEDHEFAPDK